MVLPDSQRGILSYALGDEKDAGSSSQSDQAGASDTEFATEYLKRAASEPASGGEFGEYELQVQDRRRQPPTSSQMQSILQYLRATPAPPEHLKTAFEKKIRAAQTQPSPVPEEDRKTPEEGSVAADAGAGSNAGVSVKNAATLRKVRQMQMKAQEAKDQARKEKQQAAMDTASTVDALPRPPRDPEPKADAPSSAGSGQSDSKSATSHLLERLTPPSNPAGAPSIPEGPLCVWWDGGQATTSLAGIEAMLARMKSDSSEAGAAGQGGACSIM